MIGISDLANYCVISEGETYVSSLSMESNGEIMILKDMVVPLSKGWRKARGFFVLLDRSPDMTIVVSNKGPDRPNIIFNFLRKGQTFTH